MGVVIRHLESLSEHSKVTKMNTQNLARVLAPTLVAEVGYEHMEGTRFRHTAQFKRWRDDRDPASCTYEQLEEVAAYDLDAIVD